MKEVMTMNQYDTDKISSTGNNFLMGLVCGAAVGAAVGLLLAPKTGAQMRQQLADSTDRLRKRATDGYATAVHSVSDAVDDVVARGNKAVQRGKTAYEDVRQSANAAILDVKAGL
jgi:gas vesicle protein